MALQMTRPTKHPRSGVFRIRVAIPMHLRAITERRYGKRTEFIETLETKDGAEAKRLTPPVLAKVQSWLAAAQAEFDGRPLSLTDRQIAALGGHYVAYRAAQDAETTPRADGDWDTEIDYLFEVQRYFEGDEEASHVSFEDALHCVEEGMTTVLSDAVLHIDADSQRRLVRALIPYERHHLQDLAERVNTGRWRPSLDPADFPILETHQAPRPAAEAATGTTFDVLLERWALDRGYEVNAKPIARALYDRQRTLERLSAFLGHRDAQLVTKADAVRWKVSLQEAGAHASTIRNDLSRCPLCGSSASPTTS